MKKDKSNKDNHKQNSWEPEDIEIKFLTSKKVIETPNAFVNLNTGEFLGESTMMTPNGQWQTGAKLVLHKDIDMVRIIRKNFISVDADALRLLQDNKIITKADIGAIMYMAIDLASELNALLVNCKEPHTIDSIATHLRMEYSVASRLMTKLYKRNILHKYLRHNKPVLYCMNPLLVARRRDFSKELFSLFAEFKYKNNKVTLDWEDYKQKMMAYQEQEQEEKTFLDAYNEGKVEINSN